MIKIAICDDEEAQVESIRHATEKYFSKKNESVTYKTFTNSFLLLEEFDKGSGFDIVLLDICMPGMLGIEVAKDINKAKRKTEIIFLTTSKEFALEAFSLGAAHYLVKPFTQEQFEEAMERALFRYHKANSSKILLKLIGGGIRVIDLTEIIYIESASHVQTVQLIDGDAIRVRQSLSQLLEILEKIAPGQFVSPYKGYIVNQKEIRTIKSNGIAMCDDREIPLVKREYKQFQQRYFNYIFQTDK